MGPRSQPRTSTGRPRRPAASRHTPSPGNQHPAPTKGALSCDTCQKLLCLLILVLAASFGVGGCVLLYSDFSVQRSRMAAANAAAHAQACTLLQTEILDLQRRGISTEDAALTARVTAQGVPAALWRGDTLVCATLEGLQGLPLGDAATVTVVEINYYLGQGLQRGRRHHHHPLLSTGGKVLDDRTFATEEFDEDEYVVFTVDYNDDEDFYICEMMAPETATGDVVRVENDNDSNDTYIRLDSKDNDKIYYTTDDHMVYDVNDSTRVHPTLNEEYILYMTPAGYILGFELANEKVPQYLYVKDSDEELLDWVAKVILPDATEPKIDVDGDLDGKGPASIDWLKGYKDQTNIDELIWNYSVNSDDVYGLTYVPLKNEVKDINKDEYQSTLKALRSTTARLTSRASTRTATSSSIRTPSLSTP